MRPIITALTGLFVAGTLALGTAPAWAAEDARCTELPAQVRAALPGADAATAAKAERRLRVGVQLCRANGERAAAKEFQAALKLLARPAGTAAAGK